MHTTTRNIFQSYQEHDRGEDHLAELDRAHEPDVLDADPHRLDVARHPAQDPAELHPVEEAHRLALRLLEDLGAQPVDDGLADLEGVALAEVEHRVRHDRQERRSRGAEEIPWRSPCAIGPLDHERGDPGRAPAAGRRMTVRATMIASLRRTGRA
jgi:hypothetical protein